MLTPAAKRRRQAEAASAKLARPFRSPVVRGGAAAATAVRHKEDLAATKQSRGPSSFAASSPTRKHKEPLGRQPGFKAPQAPQPQLTLDELVDQFTLRLDSGDRLLEQMKAEAAPGKDVQEARPNPEEKSGSSKTTSAAKDATEELPALIARWREAGRLAADEVFALVSERVARAGGVKAWRALSGEYERPDDRRLRRRPRTDGEGQDDSDDEEQREERQKDAGVRGDEDDPQEFTMTMMLASLGVEPELLGYDETEERWKD